MAVSPGVEPERRTFAGSVASIAETNLVIRPGAYPGMADLEDQPVVATRTIGAPGVSRTPVSLVRSQTTRSAGGDEMEPLTGFEPALHRLKGDCPTLDDSGNWYLADELNADLCFVGARPYR